MKNSKNQFKVNEQALINDILTNGKQGRQWYDLAVQYNIRPNGNSIQRRKSANDIWRRFNKLQGNIDFVPRPGIVPLQVGGNAVPLDFTSYWQHPHYLDPLQEVKSSSWSTLIEESKQRLLKQFKPKRLFYDIETSYNIVKAWRIGFNINLNMDDIIQERAIITIAYKWEGEEDVTVLSWNKGCDKEIIKDFVKVMAEADELVGHNVDRYDTKFIMARALKHNIPVLPKYQSTDTLKLAKKHFMLNSNKLDYIAQYLGIGHKTKHRGMEMWDDIILRNDPKALEEMIEYNVQDVFLTEQVYHKLMEYSLPKVNHASKQTGDKHTCPQCGSNHAELHKTYISSSGTKTRLMNCLNCSTNFTINNTNYTKFYERNAE